MKLPELNGKTLPAFPCFSNKRPMTPHGFKDATTNPKEFLKLLGSHHDEDYLIGVPTGETTGFDVLDVDSQGKQWYTSLPLFSTREHVTTSGGVHLLFKHYPGLRISASVIATGVDIRADGGYIIWWPATGLDVFQPDILSDWPQFLIDQLKPTPKGAAAVATPIRQPDSDPDLRWYNQNECAELLAWNPIDANVINEIILEFTSSVGIGVATSCAALSVKKYSHESKFAVQAAVRSMMIIGSTARGQRNSVLNAKAYALGRLIIRGWTPPYNIVCALWRGAARSELVEDDGADSVIRTIISGLKAGLQNPYPDLDPLPPSPAT
jgi:hypothetical protein